MYVIEHFVGTSDTHHMYRVQTSEMFNAVYIVRDENDTKCEKDIQIETSTRRHMI